MGAVFKKGGTPTKLEKRMNKKKFIVVYCQLMSQSCQSRLDSLRAMRITALKDLQRLEKEYEAEKKKEEKVPPAAPAPPSATVPTPAAAEDTADGGASAAAAPAPQGTDTGAKKKRGRRSNAAKAAETVAVAAAAESVNQSKPAEKKVSPKKASPKKTSPKKTHPLEAGEAPPQNLEPFVAPAPSVAKKPSPTAKKTEAAVVAEAAEGVTQLKKASPKSKAVATTSTAAGEAQVPPQAAVAEAKPKVSRGPRGPYKKKSKETGAASPTAAEGNAVAETSLSSPKASPKKKLSKTEATVVAEAAEEIASSASAKKKKSPKKKKDPNAPKKPLTGYMKFMQEKRPEIKASNPEMSFTDIGKEGGRLWGLLSADEKAKYN